MDSFTKIMKKYKKFYVLIAVIYFINLLFHAYGENLIIPNKKPQISDEKKVKSQLKTEILPLEKPKIVEENNFIGIIIPKNKPLVIAQKKTVKKIKSIKSKFYSKKDFEIAKKSILLMEKRKWDTAIKISKKAKDKSIYNFIVWRYLLESRNNADYSLYREFIERNSTYPRIGRVKYLSEKKLSVKNTNPKK